jgi:PhnB protein
MTVRLNPYLNFRDTAREALEFYHSVFGGELRMNTFKEFQAAMDRRRRT